MPQSAEEYAAKREADVEIRLQSLQVDVRARALAAEVDRDILVQSRAEQILIDEQAIERAEEMRPGEEVRLLTLDELRELPAPTPLVEGLLFGNTMALLAGNGGGGKTAAMIDIALCMGTGQRFLSRSVRQGRVLLVEAEGVGSIPARVTAWEASRMTEPGVAGRNIDIYPATRVVPQTLKAILELDLEKRYSLMVFDTAAALFGFDSENDNAEVSRWMGRLKELRDAVPDTCVLILHHTTEQVSAAGRRTSKHRGASSFRNDVDTLVMLKAEAESSSDAPVFQLTTKATSGGKQRDAAETVIGGLSLLPIAGHVVIDYGPQAKLTTIDLNRERRFGDVMEPGTAYPSADLMKLTGYTSKGLFQAARKHAIEAGVIELAGDTRQSGYRLTKSK